MIDELKELRREYKMQTDGLNNTMQDGYSTFGGGIAKSEINHNSTMHQENQKLFKKSRMAGKQSQSTLSQEDNYSMSNINRSEMRDYEIRKSRSPNKNLQSTRSLDNLKKKQIK